MTLPALLDVTAVVGLTDTLRQIEEVARGGREAMTCQIRDRLVTESHGSLPFDKGGKPDLPRSAP